MNVVTLVGRITRDIEVKSTQSGKTTCSFTLAIDRPTKEKSTDFINCVAWEGTANLIGRFLGKGSRVGIIGAIQSRNWEGKDGKRVYVTEVLVNRVEFIDTKKESPEKNTDLEMDADAIVPFDL